MRLCNYLKTYGNLTKSEITKLNEENLIKVNGKFQKLSSEIKDSDVVTINDEVIKNLGFYYYLYYKPKGILSVSSSKDNSYLKQIKTPVKVMPAGRLDKMSEGLMFLTNDGKMIDLITSPKTHFEKEYLVTVLKPITQEFITELLKPKILNNRLTKEIFVTLVDDYNFKIILTEGMYHQIRRIVKLSGNYVKNLKRIRIGKYELGSLQENEIRGCEKT